MHHLGTWLLAACLASLISGCGGGGSGVPGAGGTPATYTIGGTVSGLSGSGLVLQDNGGNNFSVSANGAFTFSTALDAGATYAVTVLTQPTGPAQTCSVTNGTGTVAQANVTSVAVTCVTVTFTPVTATMTSTRILHTATLLPNGQVLLTGGIVDSSLVALDSAEVYDPTGNTFAAIATRMTSLRNQHTATLLPNGLVLIAGGSNNGNGDGLNTAELYNPATQTFTALTARMATPRGGHTATLLANGQVLLTGGFFNSSVSLNTAELYNPATQTFTALPATMTSHRESHAASRLPNGQVLLTGGGSSHINVNTAELYDPATQTFTALTAAMASIRSAHTSTLLANGQILVTGGVSNLSVTNFTAFNTAESYNPVTNAFTALAATLTTSRAGHTATLLPNGAVLLTGGGTGSNSTVIVLNSAELYGP
jgi:N-acetylneuraminic acid mutarotase